MCVGVGFTEQIKQHTFVCEHVCVCVCVNEDGLKSNGLMLSNMKIDLSLNIMNIVTVSYRMHASIPPFITYVVRLQCKNPCV